MRHEVLRHADTAAVTAQARLEAHQRRGGGEERSAAAGTVLTARDWPRVIRA